MAPVALEVRMLRAMAVVAAAIGVSMYVVNLGADLSQAIGLSMIGFAAASVGIYAASRRGHHLYLPFFVLIIAIIDLEWFLDAGPDGGVGMFFFIPPIIAVSLLDKRHRWLAVGLAGVDLVALHAVGAARPGWLVPHATARARAFDLLTDVPEVVLACALVVGIIVDAYRTEQRRLSEANAALERALAEIQQLRGLLPVCAWCKKVKNDQGGWDKLETYLAASAKVQVSHGICPTCEREHFDDAGPGDVDDGDGGTGGG